MEHAKRIRNLPKWGGVGVFYSVVAHTMLAWWVLFNWGGLLLLLTFGCLLSLLAILTCLCFFLALGNVRWAAFTRLQAAVFLTWVFIGVIYGGMTLLKSST